MTLQLDSLRLLYPDGDRNVVAFDDAARAAEHGEVVAVTGPSGWALPLPSVASPLSTLTALGASR
jgi:hypothetical protein